MESEVVSLVTKVIEQPEKKIRIEILSDDIQYLSNCVISNQTLSELIYLRSF